MDALASLILFTVKGSRLVEDLHHKSWRAYCVPRVTFTVGVLILGMWSQPLTHLMNASRKYIVGQLAELKI